MTFIPSPDEHNRAAKAMQAMSVSEGRQFEILKEVQLAHYDDRPARVSPLEFQKAIN